MKRLKEVELPLTYIFASEIRMSNINGRNM